MNQAHLGLSFQSHLFGALQLNLGTSSPFFLNNLEARGQREAKTLIAKGSNSTNRKKWSERRGQVACEIRVQPLCRISVLISLSSASSHLLSVWLSVSPLENLSGWKQSTRLTSGKISCDVVPGGYKPFGASRLSLLSHSTSFNSNCLFE